MNTNQYTQKTLEALQAAQQLAVEYQHNALEPAHLLHALAAQENGLIPQLLQKLNVDPGSFAAAVAGADYDARGLTYEKLYEMREVFLLSRLAMRIHRIPMAGDVLDIATYENGVKGAHMQRVYEMKDQAGEVRVSVKSDWILVNPATRKIMRPSAFTAKPIQTCDCLLYTSPSPRDCS